MMAGAGPFVQPGITKKTQRALLVYAKMLSLAAAGGVALTVNGLLNNVRGSSSPTGPVGTAGVAKGLTQDQLAAAQIDGILAAAAASVSAPQTVSATLSGKITDAGVLTLQSDIILQACEVYLDISIAQLTN